jgi:hypothetical protein
MDNLVFDALPSKRRSEVTLRRAVVSRVVDVVKFIGKCSLPYRSHENEACYTLSNPASNHGVFLETVLLVAKYDEVLRTHVERCTEDSRNRRGPLSGRGRGSAVTFLSKTFVNLVLTTILKAMQRSIIQEVKDSGIYSFQFDTTLDRSVTDQGALVLRYITNGQVLERFLGVVPCTSAKADDLYRQISELLMSHGLDLQSCIGCSVDGAANMSGALNGVQAKFTAENDQFVHVWCYAHRVNLWMSDCTEVVPNSITLWGLLNNIGRLYRESFKVMQVWETQTAKSQGVSRLLKIGLIGRTRWWAKDRALSKVFGDPDVFVAIILSLSLVANDSDFSGSLRHDASSYLHGLCKFDTILTAMTFKRIFKQTTPLSKYLQTEGMDYLQAQAMVESTGSGIASISRTFDEVRAEAEDFCQNVNKLLAESEAQNAVAVEAELCATIRRRGQRGDALQDLSPVEQFKIRTFNPIMDAAHQSFVKRFEKCGGLYSEAALLDPKRFKDVSNLKQKPKLPLLGACVNKYFHVENAEALIADELVHLSSRFDMLHQASALTTDSTSDDNLEFPELVEELDEEDGEDAQRSGCPAGAKRCPCFICVFRVLHKYSFYADTYANLFKAYKFLLTLSVTQVKCERCFSKLSQIKTKLRSSLKGQSLDAFMVMSIEPEVLSTITNDEILDLIAASSGELRRMLSY